MEISFSLQFFSLSRKFSESGEIIEGTRKRGNNRDKKTLLPDACRCVLCADSRYCGSRRA